MLKAESPPLRIAAIVPPEGRWDPGQLRLLEALCEDPRFDLVRLEYSETDANPFGRIIDGYLAIEARFGVPCAEVLTPNFDQVRPEVGPIANGALQGIDVILDLAEACGTDIDTLADMATHGLWRVSTTSQIAGLEASFSGASMSQISLTSRNKGAWYRRVAANYDVKFLATRNRAYLRDKAVHLVLHALANLDAPLCPQEVDPRPAVPKPLAFIAYGGRVVTEVLRRLRDKLRARFGGRPGRFELRVCDGSPLNFDLASGHQLDAPKGHFWADPFSHTSGAETHVFYEDFDYVRGLGHLAVARLDGADLHVLGDTHCPAHHLSYPHVFDYEGAVYMLMESGQIARQELWRATDYPLKWALEKTLLEDVRCADTTLFQYDGAWWLFTNICRDSFSDFCGELYAFRVDSPALNRLEPHQLNPIVVGADRARGAGRVFQQDGKLYRPSQDNTHSTYGYGLNIMEIEDLTLDTYAERRVRHITPSDAPGIIGCHHIDRIDKDRVIVDVRYR